MVTMSITDGASEVERHMTATDSRIAAKMLRTRGRQWGAAKFVRRNFTRGSRVVNRAGATGTILRHVAMGNGLGGYLIVQWDEAYRPFGGDGIGRVNATNVEVTR